MWKRILDQGFHVDHVLLCMPISGACLRSRQICLLLPEVEMCFFFEALVSSMRYISELVVPGFGRPMQLLKSEVDQF